MLTCVQLMDGGEDDFSTLLYILRCAQESGDLRRWCRENFVHHRVVMNGTHTNTCCIYHISPCHTCLASKVHQQLLGIIKALKMRDLESEMMA